MIFFLYGQDQYRLKKKLNEIIDRYKQNQKSNLYLRHLDLKGKEFKDLENEIQSASIFDERKLVILENVALNNEFQEKFLKGIKKFKESKDIILFSEKEDISKDKFFLTLKKYAKYQEFEFLRGERLKDWIRREFAKYKTEIEDSAINKLIEFTGNDLWQIDNEIKKLVSYKNRAKIQLKDIAKLVKPKIESDIFKTIDAIAQKNKKLALHFIHKHLEKGDSPSYLFSMINFQFRNLLMLKSKIQSRNYFQTTNNLSQELGLHPFVIEKTLRQTKKFSLEELKKIYKKIFTTDFNIKTGKIDPQVALDLFIAEI